MALVQNILAYLILAMALGYLINRYFLPNKLVLGKKKKKGSCGSSDCGCS